MINISIENNPFTNIDKPKSAETPKAIDIIKKYGNKNPEIKKIVWEKTQKLRKNYPNLSDEAFYNLIGGKKFKDTFQPKENIQPKSIKTPKFDSFEKIPKLKTIKTGSEFIDELKQIGDLDHSPKAREKMAQKILEEIDAGHIPSFCHQKNFKTVTMSNSAGTKVQFRTSADYLSIGTDDNYVRIPITPILALKLHKKYGWGMPTAKMTDTIYNQAGKQLKGIGLVKSKEDTEHMQSAEFINRHNQLYNQQLTSQEKDQIAKGELLVAGHKKDIILSRYAIDHPDVMDFRGLYLTPGKPIQTNPAHTPAYSDYAQGFRLIAPQITIINPNHTSETMSYYQALKDPKIAHILNGTEGAIDARQAYHGKIYNQSYEKGRYLA